MMDSKTFLDNFDTIAKYPGGVDRLRELILTLAVRGELTRRDPGNGGVETQLSDLASLLQLSNLVDPIVDDTAPWEIPSSWRWVRFK